MNQKNIALSIVLPVYNEEECIEEAVNNIFQTFIKSKINFELMVVNDGSTDNTSKICLFLKKKFKFSLITLDTNEGYSKALKTGFLNARGKYITYLDADLQYLPSEILKLYQETVKYNYDFVIGYPEKKMYRGRAYKYFRRFLSKFYNFLVRLLFNISIKDVHSKRVFKRDIFDYRKIKAYFGLIDLELLLLAIRAKAKIKQVPIEIKPRFAGKSKLNIKLMIITLMNMLRLRIIGFEK